jgi:hypothetical protein
MISHSRKKRRLMGRPASQDGTKMETAAEAPARVEAGDLFLFLTFERGFIDRSVNPSHRSSPPDWPAGRPHQGHPTFAWQVVLYNQLLEL